jgi:hypothetical protein
LIIFSGGGGGGGGYIINFIEVCHNEWMNEFCWEDTLSFFFFLYFWAVDWRRSSRVGRLHRFWRWFEYLERKKFLYVFTWVKKFFVKSCGGEGGGTSSPPLRSGGGRCNGSLPVPLPPRPLPPVPSPAPPKKGGGGGRRGRRGEEWLNSVG